MKIIAVNNVCTMYSEIIVEQECSNCKDWKLIGKAKDHPYCEQCKGYGIIEVKHTVTNHGWLPLEWWIKKFEGM